MRLRQLNLEIQTESGPFGGEITFSDGLVVVWADNSMGKSTCVRSILVALGLEAMLTTNQSELPLTQAPLDHLEDADGVRHKVLESDVYLQLENAKGENIAVRRTLVGTRDKNLITVVFGPLLTTPESTYSTKNFFVNRDGGATRESGFHSFLADFLGWQLPIVQRYEEGRECPNSVRHDACLLVGTIGLADILQTSEAALQNPCIPDLLTAQHRATRQQDDSLREFTRFFFSPAWP